LIDDLDTISDSATRLIESTLVGEATKVKHVWERTQVLLLMACAKVE